MNALNVLLCNNTKPVTLNWAGGEKKREVMVGMNLTKRRGTTVHPRCANKNVSKNKKKVRQVRKNAGR